MTGTAEVIFDEAVRICFGRHVIYVTDREVQLCEMIDHPIEDGDEEHSQ